MTQPSNIKSARSFDAAVRILTFNRRIPPVFYVFLILIAGGVIALQNRLPGHRAGQTPSMKPLADTLMAADPPEAHLLADDLRYFQKIAKTSPDRADAHAVAGYCLYYLNQRPQAVNELKRAAKLHPQFFWFYYNLGMAYYEMGDFTQAIGAFENALEVRPETALLYISSSKIYQDILQSLPPGSYSPITALRQGYRTVHHYLMFSYYQRKDFQTMMQVAIVADGRFGSDGEFLYYAGVAAYEQGLAEEAAVLFERCLKINPNDSRAMVYLAAALQKMGKAELAGKILIRARLLHGPDTLPPVIPPEALPLRIL